MCSLKREFQWYLRNRDALVAQHEGKVLVIKNEALLGTFENEMEAIKKTMSEHELGTFLVQECSSDPHSTSATFHSRVWV